MEFKRKWEELKANKSIVVFTGVFIVHVVWLINTSNFNYAFHDLGNKAIILLYPIIIGTSEKLSFQQIKKIIIWFTLALVTSSLISTSILVEIIDYPVKDLRDISAFMSHIRLSLLINVGIFTLGYILFSGNFKNKRIENILGSVFIVWFIVFLFLLKSFTGLAVFLAMFFIVLGYGSFSIKELIPRLFLQVGLITVFLVIASYITHSISKFYTKHTVDITNLDKYTEAGNTYESPNLNGVLENGNYLWIYVCEEELQKEWEKRSEIPFYGTDKKGQEIKYTIIRYLASKAYRKDSVGVSKLSDQDVINIENGMANYIYQNKYALYPKIYEVLWQIDRYKKGYPVLGSSVTLRIIFFNTALDIIKDNFWFGVGTGDVQDAFYKQYEINESKLPKEYRYRAHNQYLTFLISFGIVGFILVFFAMFYPAFVHKGFRNYLFVVVFLIALLSFLNEDTLETQIGITFFTFFYSLFLFGHENSFRTKQSDEGKRY
ncbi:MAG: O-antigen ligase family protein [Bacteroidetes bacterium]|nr:O-antigen ligase family protein [Bacteroidota bacterium]